MSTTWPANLNWCRFTSSIASLAFDSRITTSSLFIPTRKVAEAEQSPVLSHKRMLQAGLIRLSSSGVYYFLPLGLRALERLIGIVDDSMRSIGCSKMVLPMLMPASLWKVTGRWNGVGPELFKLVDQHGTEYCIGPTHEEAVTDVVKQELISYKQLPLRLYQLDRKFRDEKRPRSGLLRAREFWMKDLYTFDATKEEALHTYDKVCAAYDKLFKKLELNVRKVRADTGSIGGSLSHEYHILTAVGEDRIVTCATCGLGYNRELLSDSGALNFPDCPESRDQCAFVEHQGVEVGHVFYLGTKYSAAFKASFYDQSNEEKLCEMGCFGLGISRMLAATIEHSACQRADDRIIWPQAIAPYFVCITPLTTSKEPDDPWMSQAMELYDALNSIFPGDIVLEDRVYLSVGGRLRELQLIGCPVSVIIGPKVLRNCYEVQFSGTETVVLDKDSVINYIAEKQKLSGRTLTTSSISERKR